MGPLTVIAESMHALRKNKVRTGLSILGIVIGIAAVIAMVAVATGAQRRVEEEIARTGNDWLVIWYWGVQHGGVRRQQGLPPNVAREDAEAILRECPGVRAVCLADRRMLQVISGYGNHQPSVRGVEAAFFDIRRWGAVAGRVLTPEDVQLQNKVCVLGVTPARELFGGLNPVGQVVRVNRAAFEVVGVLEPKGTSSDGQDYDDEVILPLTTYQRMISGNRPPHTIFVAARPGTALDTVKQQIRSTLRPRHRLADSDDDDFRMFDRAESAAASAEATRTFNLLVTSIASISLLVGGIGIMNIMLVSVTERTREIGLRMAIGAKATHILGQFLCEAVVLCTIGGLVGFLGGWGVAEIVRWQRGWDTEISYWMAGVAIAFATAVGVFFGFYPAWRASRLNPIDALRYE